MGALWRWMIGGAVLLLGISAAAAADLRVLSAGALKPLVAAEAPAFERETGHRLLIENDTAGRLTRQVQDGRAFDVVIVTRAGIEQLAAAGKLALDSAVPLARI